MRMAFQNMPVAKKKIRGERRCTITMAIPMITDTGTRTATPIPIITIMHRRISGVLL